jgi:hypothetical protein
MEVNTFAELEQEFMDRVNRVVWCSLATIDRQNRPRSRVVHPVWEGAVGWLTTRRATLKTKHLALNPHISLAYVTEITKPVYVDCQVEWVEDMAERRRVCDFIKAQSAPMGFDAEAIFLPIDHPNFGLLRLIPWRVEVANIPGTLQVWHAAN